MANSTPRTQTTLRLPDRLMERLKQEAERRGVSMNELAIMLLHAALALEER